MVGPVHCTVAPREKGLCRAATNRPTACSRPYSAARRPCPRIPKATASCRVLVLALGILWNSYTPPADGGPTFASSPKRFQDETTYGWAMSRTTKRRPFGVLHHDSSAMSIWGRGRKVIAGR